MVLAHPVQMVAQAVAAVVADLIHLVVLALQVKAMRGVTAQPLAAQMNRAAAAVLEPLDKLRLLEAVLATVVMEPLLQFPALL